MAVAFERELNNTLAAVFSRAKCFEKLEKFDIESAVTQNKNKKHGSVCGLAVASPTGRVTVVLTSSRAWFWLLLCQQISWF